MAVELTVLFKKINQVANKCTAALKAVRAENEELKKTVELALSGVLNSKEAEAAVKRLDASNNMLKKVINQIQAMTPTIETPSEETADEAADKPEEVAEVDMPADATDGVEIPVVIVEDSPVGLPDAPSIDVEAPAAQ